jgi:hypothetical protein
MVEKKSSFIVHSDIHTETLGLIIIQRQTDESIQSFYSSFVSIKNVYKLTQRLTFNIQR